MTLHIKKLIAGPKACWHAKKGPDRDVATKQTTSDIPKQEVARARTRTHTHTHTTARTRAQTHTHTHAEIWGHATCEATA